jgi:hypothetical protein
LFEQLLVDAPLGTTGNHYSTSQIVETLNDFLCSSAEILFKNSEKFRAHIATMLAVFQTDHRKHLSNASLRDTQVAIFHALSTHDFNPIKQIYMDRSFLFSAVASMMYEISMAADIERKLLVKFSAKRERKLAQIKAHLGLASSPILIEAAVDVWLNLYVEFRNENINKYIRLAFNKAKSAKENSDIYVDIKELTMNYILAINRAIDKCDLTKGTLTSYVEKWFLNAKTNADFSHEYNVAYTMPAAQRSKSTKLKNWHLQSNFSPSLDEDNAELKNEIEQIVDENTLDFDQFNIDVNLLKKYRNIKQTRLAFLTMRLPIILTEEEIKLLKS